MSPCCFLVVSHSHILMCLRAPRLKQKLGCPHPWLVPAVFNKIFATQVFYLYLLSISLRGVARGFSSFRSELRSRLFCARNYQQKIYQIIHFIHTCINIFLTFFLPFTSHPFKSFTFSIHLLISLRVIWVYCTIMNKCILIELNQVFFSWTTSSHQPFFTNCLHMTRDCFKMKRHLHFCSWGDGSYLNVFILWANIKQLINISQGFLQTLWNFILLKGFSD